MTMEDHNDKERPEEERKERSEEEVNEMIRKARILKDFNKIAKSFGLPDPEED